MNEQGIKQEFKSSGCAAMLIFLLLIAATVIALAGGSLALGVFLGA